MKVLLITGLFPPLKCGIGLYNFLLHKNLLKKKINIEILTSSSQTKKKNIYNIIDNWSLVEIFKIIKLVKKLSPDIIHIHYPSFVFAGKSLPYLLPLLFFFLKRKTIITLHELFNLKSFINFFFIIISNAQLVVVRDNYFKQLNKIFKFFFPKNFYYIPNSTTLDLTKKFNFKKKNYLPKSFKRFFIFYGFLFPHKGVELIPEIINLKTDFVIISTNIDKNNEYHKFIINFFKNKKLKKNFLIKYYSDNTLIHLLKYTDGIILPFTTETGKWNTTINNSVASGNFTLTTSAKQFGYDSNNNIFYSKINDIPSMKAALNKYAGKKIKIKKYTWDEITEKYLNIYENL